MAGSEYPTLYLEGIRWFNQREFFEAHEVWEELWTSEQGPSRRFYQGLIQVAVCLHHFGNRNTRGTRKLYHSSRRYLSQYPSHYLGLDIDRLFADMERCCGSVANSQDDFPHETLDPQLLPQIHLTTPPGELE